jgi:hypothetical protein
MLRSLSLVAVVSLVLGCNTGEAKPEPKPEAKVEQAATPAPSSSGSQLRFGAPIDAKSEKVALAEVAKAPNNFVNKTFQTTGTVTAVCQHMGCWMEIKDDASEAHIKMAGHAFFVPKTASGRKARVLGKLAPAANAGACEGEGHEGMAAAGGGGAKEKGKGCRAEAEEQLGRPLAKLELVADGVELM